MTCAEFDMHGAPVRSKGVQLETVGWGLFFVWVGVCLLAGFSWGMFFFGAGVLMLGSQAVRHHSGLRLDRFSVAVGTCFVAAAWRRWPKS